MISGYYHSRLKYPNGETGIRTQPGLSAYQSQHLTFEYANDGDIIELLLLVDAMKRNHHEIETLTIPFFPYSRQDRVTVEGEALGVAVIANLINSIGAKEVVILDPHSDVTPALINNVTVVSQADAFLEVLQPQEPVFHYVSPDAGALKKIHALNQRYPARSIITCTKHRNPETGVISEVSVPHLDLTGAAIYIVDDICDGGATFVNIVKELKKMNPEKIVLYVTHGFFTKGLEVFDGLIDEIYTWKGKVK